MVPVLTLWAPILASAVLVFLASAVLHMVLPYHRSDFRKVPSEDEVMDALRRFAIPPGNYMMPHAEAPSATVTGLTQEREGYRLELPVTRLGAGTQPFTFTVPKEPEKDLSKWGIA